MPGIRTIAVLLAVVLAPIAGVAADLPKAKPPGVGKPAFDADKALADATQAEKDGQYEKALQLYLRVFTSGRPDADLRDRIRHCFRHVAQAERHRDPAFAQFVLSLPPTDALALYAEAVERIQKNYTDRGQATPDKLFVAGLDELAAALTEPNFRKDHLKDATDAKIAEFRELLANGLRAKLPTTAAEARAAARGVVSAANKTLGLKNGSVVVFELLCGACGGLDEYSAFVPPSASADVPALVELASYGLIVRLDKALVVEAVRAGSWAAAHTKLRKGDRIERVNGKPVGESGAAALADALRSADARGHLLELTPAEDGEARAQVLPTPLPTVYAVDLIDAKEGIGYLRLAAFKDRTLGELDDAILELKNRGMKALVIDLRGNPGGLFTSALNVARRFVPGGPLVSTDGQVPDFANRVFGSDTGMAAHEFPVVLLVDTKTMSAAEILAASLKDTQRATLVGLPTFGKGLIQGKLQLHALDADPDAPKSGLLILSVGTVSSPLGGLLNGRGVSPHVIETNADRQLERAIEAAVELIANPRPMPLMPPVDR